ncbi:MAG: TetR/AcrR family transcriptional regulator, partial [Myxococcota bacterium]
VAQGYHRTSVEQIVTEAGVARGTFYLYFASKSALFKHLLNKVLDPLMASLTRCRRAIGEAHDTAEVRDAFMQLSAEAVSLVLAHRDLTLLYYSEQRDPGAIGVWLREQGHRIEAFAEDMVRALTDRGLLRPIEPSVAALIITGAIDKLAFAFLSGADLGNPMSVGSAVVQLFGVGLLVEPEAYLSTPEPSTKHDR